jgi:hypothetical protein
MTDTNISTNGFDPRQTEIIQTIVATAIAQSPSVRFEAGTYEGVDQSGDGIVLLDSMDPDLPDRCHVVVVGHQPLYGARVVIAHTPRMASYLLGEVQIPAISGELQPRFLLDSPRGEIRLYDSQGILVGLLSSSRWFAGVSEEGSRVQIDPVGGVRLHDDGGHIRVSISPTEGVGVRDAVSGITGGILRYDGLVILDPETGERISITSGSTSAVPSPHWASLEAVSPGSTLSTPAISSFATGDDLDLRHVAASIDQDLGAQSMTAPGGFTERSDTNHSGGNHTLHTSSASRDPADASPGGYNFAPSTAGYSRALGQTVIVRGGGASSPAVRAVEVGLIYEFNTGLIELDVAAPPVVSDGDLLVAFLSLSGPNIPVGWAVPEGFIQLGVRAAGLGTTHVLGGGTWYKRWNFGDPLVYPILINMSSAVGLTKVHAIVLAIQNPYAFPAGLDIRRNNRSMPRGLIASVEATTHGTVASTSPDYSWSFPYPQYLEQLNDIPMLAGRSYEIAYNLLIYEFANNGGGYVDVAIELNTGAGWAWWHRAERSTVVGGVDRSSLYISRIYKPIVDETVDVRIGVYNAATGNGHAFWPFGGGDYRRVLSVTDVGAVY